MSTARQPLGSIPEQTVRVAQAALTQMAGDIVKQPIALLSGLIALLAIDARFTLLAFTVFLPGAIS